jgi:hypothetical protein
MPRTTKKPLWTVPEAEKQLAIAEQELEWAEDYVSRMKIEIERRKKELEAMHQPDWKPRRNEYPRYRFGM